MFVFKAGLGKVEGSGYNFSKYSKSFQNNVQLNERIYGHDYLFLIRDIVKDIFLDSVLPVKVSDLKDLGIDIASAPANGTIGDRQVCFLSFTRIYYHVIQIWLIYKLMHLKF